MPAPPPCVASSLDDEIDLDAGPKRQGGHPDHRTGGKGLTEMLGVNAIQRHVITHVRKIHTSAHDIIETLAARLENRREILEDAVRLGRDTSRHQLARRRILADLTAEIDETAGVNGLGKRAHRRGEFRRGNCDLGHGKLLWTMGSMISLLFMMENRQFHSFIIITMILIATHDSAIRWERQGCSRSKAESRRLRSGHCDARSRRTTSPLRSPGGLHVTT